MKGAWEYRDWYLNSALESMWHWSWSVSENTHSSSREVEKGQVQSRKAQEEQIPL